MTDRELMQQALEKLEFFSHMKSVSEDTMRLITALRAALAEPEPPYWGVFEGGNLHDIFTTREMAEEMAYYKGTHATVGPLYTAPPQRKPLTPQSPCEMTQAERKMFKLGWLECEAAHGIKGEA